MLTTDQFDRVRSLTTRLTGIELCDRHRELISHRLRRSDLGARAKIDGLLDAVEQGVERAQAQLIHFVTTGFTGFFRHPWHFDIAAEHALWAAHRRGHARLWCAASATGE